jgi:uncharacterized SAM-binding protein YcdF (DUF218 family)
VDLRRVPAAGLAEGGATAVALWCILLSFGLLPGVVADDYGVETILVVGMVIGASRLRRVLRPMLIAGATAVLVVALTPLSSVISARWLRDDPVPESGVAAVVVLSAGLTPDTTTTFEALDHLITGLELIRARKSDLLVTTTVEQRFSTGHVSSQTDQARIVDLFGGGVRWLRSPVAHSTHDEAVLSAAMLQPQGVRRIAVVASPMHTRRACASFEAVGFEVVCVPSRMRGAAGRIISPSPRFRLAAFGEWVYEVAGIAKYRTLGWVHASTGGTQ